MLDSISISRTMRYLLTIIFLISFSFSSNAQIEKFQALFMYKFLQNFEWPASKVSNNYKIGVVGSDALKIELEKLVNGRSVQGKTIAVTNYTPGSSNKEFCMIFIGAKRKDLFESLNKSAISNSTIIVTESPGYAKKGAAINFITAGSSLKFELNSGSFSQANVKVSGSIKSLAVIVN